MGVKYAAAGNTCHECGYAFEKQTGLSGGKNPKPGDVSMCLSCGALAIYEESAFGLRTRPATPSELDVLRADPEIRRALAVRAVRVGDSLRGDS